MSDDAPEDEDDAFTIDDYLADSYSETYTAATESRAAGTSEEETQKSESEWRFREGILVMLAISDAYRDDGPLPARAIVWAKEHSPEGRPGLK